MSNPFFDHPILNSPYEYPRRHWELDPSGQPTQRINRTAPPCRVHHADSKPKKRKSKGAQPGLVFDEGKGLSTKQQQYDPTSIINEVRQHVATWRTLPRNAWQVTPESARLLEHWRHHNFAGVRPFFCQIEAVETAIWLTEVAPHLSSGKRILEHLVAANRDANPQLHRVALKLATGAGKTTVMAMLIAWQTVNAVRRPSSKHFTRGFLIIAPGLTIKDRLRVLQPNDPDSYYAGRELVPSDLLDDIKRAKIVITNYHALKLRERVELSAGGRALLKGRTGPDLQTQETDGQMLQRVMPDLMGMKNILVLNERGAPLLPREAPRPGRGRAEGRREKRGREEQPGRPPVDLRPETVNRKLGISRVMDLSATPFFLRGSGYAEGTLFPWAVSDFSLMDVIECGIVKLPRVPVAENIPGDEAHSKVVAYTKNHNLGLEVPYRYGSETRRYLPDFIVLVDDGHGADDLLHLVVEIKGFRREDAKEKKTTMETYWVPGLNNLKTYGRWAFAEFTEIYQMQADFAARVESEFNKMIMSVSGSIGSPATAAS